MYLKITKEEQSLKLSFLVMSANKNQSKCQNTALLLLDIQVWIDFYMLT